MTRAYALGFEKVLEVADWSKAAGVRELTFWALSEDNMKKRSKTELQILLNLSESYLRQYFHKLVEKNVRVTFYGNLQELPPKLRDLMLELEKETGNCKLPINILFNFSRHAIPHAPDLIVRTGGEYRLSGFIPEQSVYAELYFEKRLWAELRKKDFNKMMLEVSKRKRRFGK